MLLELDYAQAYAVDKDSVDAEGALIALAAANVEALWLPALDLAFLPNTRERQRRAADRSRPLGTRRPAERLCPWREARDLRRPKLTNCSE